VVSEEKSKFPMKWMVVGVFIGIVIIAFTVFVLVNRPRLEDLEITLLDGFVSMDTGLNCLYTVDVTVKNNGGGRWVKVYAEISGSERYEKKDQQQRIYLDDGENKSLHYVFDISFWKRGRGEPSYRAWCVVD